MSTPNLHICIGDRGHGHLELLQGAAASSQVDFDWWDLPQGAAPGDEVVFYLIGPVSAFVALGTVGEQVLATELPETERNHPRFGFDCFWMRNARMLTEHVRISQVMERFPDWARLRRMEKATVPPEIADAFLKFLGASPLLQIACDFSHPPEQIATTTYRFIRDTDMTRDVKRLHNFECQICGSTINLPNGDRYAEAHHIRPLGRGHRGDDLPGNILCLCPNHHAELDYGVRSIPPEGFPPVAGHMVDRANIEYHNTKIYNQSLPG